jgi:predicted RNA-binding Zn-ribbon protein involved in translation (DUF1610 family)
MTALSTLEPMVETVVCPQCGASNVHDAEWCGQCYARLTESEDDHPEDAVLQVWECAVCATEVSVAETACPTCGSDISTTLDRTAEIADPSEALRSSFLPGYGLSKVDRGGEGIIVAILGVFPVLGGLAIIVAGEPLGVLLVMCGIAIWIVSARDAYAVASGEEPWLRPRALTFVAVIVLLVLAIALMRALPGAIR